MKTWTDFSLFVWSIAVFWGWSSWQIKQDHHFTIKQIPNICLTLSAGSDWIVRVSDWSFLLTLTVCSCWVAASWPATPPESSSTISNCSFSSFFLNYNSQVKDGVQCWKLSYPLNLNHLLHLANDLFCMIAIIICLYFRLKFKWDGFFNLFTLKCV